MLGARHATENVAFSLSCLGMADARFAVIVRESRVAFVHFLLLSAVSQAGALVSLSTAHGSDDRLWLDQLHSVGSVMPEGCYVSVPHPFRLHPGSSPVAQRGAYVGSRDTDRICIHCCC